MRVYSKNRWYIFQDIKANSVYTPCNKYQIPGCCLAAGQAEGMNAIKAEHSREVFMTGTGYSLSSLLCRDSFACLYYLLSVQPQPQSGVKHENGPGCSCFGDGKITEDVNMETSKHGKHIEGDLI